MPEGAWTGRSTKQLLNVVFLQAEQQQAEYNARLKVIRQEANRKAAEEARRHQLRQRALDHMQPASAVSLL